MQWTGSPATRPGERALELGLAVGRRGLGGAADQQRGGDQGKKFAHGGSFLMTLALDANLMRSRLNLQ